MYPDQKFQVIHSIYLRGISKALSADKFYPYIDFVSIIKKHNLVSVHFKFSCQYQFAGKTMTSKAKVKINKIQKMVCVCQPVSDDFKNVPNDYFDKNCQIFPGSMITSGLRNGCP